jgi:TolB-like protein
MRLFAELSRRNVIRGAIAYAAVGWLVIEVGSVLLPAFNAPDWMLQALIIVVFAGFLPALILAWRYELTPSGLVEETAAESAGQDSVMRGRRVDMAIIGVLALALALVVAERLTLEQRAGGGPQLGIAVLPFENLSVHDEDAYLASGMHEEVLTSLSHIRELRVIAGATMRRIAEMNLTVSEIGERYDVAYVLDGSVRRDGDRVRVAVQLADTDSNQQLWAENYDRASDNIFNVQSEVALAIAAHLNIELEPGSRDDILNVSTADPKAFTLYLRMIDEVRSTRSGGDPDIVRGLLEQAVALDPDFLQAKVFLAARYMAAGGEFEARALRMVAEIRERWPDHYLSKQALGYYLYIVERDYQGALDQFEAVVAAMPGDIVAVVNVRNAYKRLDRREEFLYWARRAQELSPESSVVAGELATALVANREFDEAMAFTRASEARFPNDPSWEILRIDQIFDLLGDVDAFLAAAKPLETDGRWSDLQENLSWLLYEHEGLAAAEAHLEARRANRDVLDSAIADMDHALMLRQEGRATEAQALADRALSSMMQEFPVDESDPSAGFGNLYIAQVAAVAGDHETARAYRALAPNAESFSWVFWRALIECANGELDALLGDAAGGWARYAPYADDPYLCSSRAAMSASPLHRLLFQDAQAFREFTAAE